MNFPNHQHPVEDLSNSGEIGREIVRSDTADEAAVIILPSQTGNSGKVLSTDGSVTSWIAAGSAGTVTSVGVSSSDMSVSGSPVTAAGTISLALNTVGISKGGTGQTTANAALNALLPTQTSNAGKVLSTDGSNTSWVAAGSAGTVTSVSVASTDLSVSGSPITASGTITLNINSGAVTLGKMADVATQTILGRNTAGTGSPEALSASTTKSILSLGNVENTALSTWAGSTNLTTLGTIATGTWSGSTIALNKGGTGSTTADGALTNLLPSQGGNSGKVLSTNGSVTSWISAGGTGTVTSVSIGAPAAGITQSGSPVTASGTITLALANDLAALEGLSGTGFAQRTGVDTWALASAAALTKTDDTNVTITLGGSPTTALLASTSLTLGWNGQLGMTRGGTGQSTCTMGDTLYASAANTWGKLGIGGTGYILAASSGGIPEWIQSVTATHGGTAQTSYAQGDTLYASAVNTLSKLPIGSSGQVLTVGGGNVPVWSTPGSGGTVTSVAVSSSDMSVSGSPITSSGTISLALNTVPVAKGGTGATTADGALTNLLPSQSGNSGKVLSTNGSVTSWISAGGTGTVTSVGISSTDLSVSGSPVTASGTIALDINSGAVTLAKMANMATASILGRSTAGTGAPEVLSASTTKTVLSLNNVENTALSTWAGSSNIITVGTITSGDWAGNAVPIGYGGTGSTTATDAFDALSPATTKGDLVTINLGTNVRIPVGTNGQVLSADSTATGGIKWVTPSSGSGTVTSVGVSSSDMSVSGSPVTTSGTISLTLNTVGVTKGGTGLTSATTGDLLYASASNTYSRRSIGNTGDVLTVSGGVPTWAAPATPAYAFAIVKKTSGYSAANSDGTIICNFASDGDITLPVSSVTDGHFYTVVRTGGAGIVTVKDGNGNTLRAMNTAMASSTWVWCNTDSAYYETARIAGT